MAPVAKKEVVTNITDQLQFEQLKETEKLLMIDFYTRWCGPCTAIVPTMKSMQITVDSFDDRVKFLQLERHVIPEYEKKFAKTSKPKFLFMKNQEILREVDGCDAPMISKTINELIPAIQVGNQNEN
jgi:thioredoxin 1